MSIIKLTLSALQDRLKEDRFYIQNTLGYTSRVAFKLNKGIKEATLLNLAKNMDINLPVDYKEFLIEHNGAELFIDQKAGTRFRLLSINEIEEYKEMMDYPEGWFPIAIGFEGSILIINSNNFAQNKRANDYIYWLETGESFEECTSLNMNFEMWLDFFIVSQGSKFWEWSIYNSEKYYTANDLI
ncbi:SMI1/KNR4 family protein [Ferdinandcohnia quinoae]|uniref:SMI1/KNR4 family protein n=1 Tax=Fredinandcohnia quinoae TaxID=2918902 RepID=A0AAW5E995_9BACI|nr:SMI1/KNR4 family protein [Fredinandcohnia sp. SECRCQ15]MCH1625961.1 SMI1/KNR4 family protein [Fredinandcohnia sp. SECRCQ15]